jgi:Fe-S cluster assembly protein SufD
MTQAQQTLDNHVANHRKIADELPGADQTWLQNLREEGLAAFSEQGWPTQSLEAWKYTSLQEVRETAFASPNLVAEPTVSAEDLQDFKLDIDTAQLVFVNGQYREEFSDLSPVDEVTVTSLAEVLENEPERLEAYLGNFAEPDDEALTGLNTASFADGAFVEVPEGTVVDEPIHVLHVTADVGEPVAVHPRTLVVANANSQVSVVETYAGVDDAHVLTNAVTEIAANENATVDHVRLNRENDETIHVGTQEFEQQRDSNVRSTTVTFGSKLTRNNVYDVLDAEGVDAVLNGLYMGTEDQHVDNFTNIRHDEPHGDSRQLYKGVLDDASRGVFRGTIYVSPGAQKTNGYQHNPNLLLSEDSLANSVPQLEIFADDVKCSHGSTTGDVDEKWLFYLQSRGLSKDEAQDLLTYSFAGEVIEEISIEPVREVVQDLVLDKLPNGDKVRDAL